MGTVEPPARVDQPVWTRTLIGWHIVFWVLLAMTLAGLALGRARHGIRRIVYTGAIVLLGAAYQFVGLPAITSRRRLPSYVYRLVLIGCLMVLVGLYPQSVFMMFIASAQIWLLCQRMREDAAFSLLLVIGVGYRAAVECRLGLGRVLARSCRGWWSAWSSACCSGSGSSG